jgi:hypothetical protein
MKFLIISWLPCLDDLTEHAGMLRQLLQRYSYIPLLSDEFHLKLVFLVHSRKKSVRENTNV